MKRSEWVSGVVLRLCFPALIFAGWSAVGSAATVGGEPELLEANKAFQVTARLVSDRKLEISYNIVDGYYMYRDRFRFEVNGEPVVLDKKAWPAGKLKKDATFGKVITYRKRVRVLLPVPAPGKDVQSGSDGGVVSLKATSQGCADAGVCYPPLHQILVLHTGSSEWAQPQEEVVSGFSRERAGGLMDRLTQGK